MRGWRCWISRHRYGTRSSEISNVVEPMSPNTLQRQDFRMMVEDLEISVGSRGEQDKVGFPAKRRRFCRFPDDFLEMSEVLNLLAFP